MRKMTFPAAVEDIERKGILLVFPIANQLQPPSLWHCFFPRAKMRWEWDDAGDTRVVDLWHLREELSRSGRAVYTKWFQNRATFFSKSVAAAMMANNRRADYALSKPARAVLSVLEENSPVSSKRLRKIARNELGISSKEFSSGLTELWQRLLIVGFGEVDDGAFPSLAIGATGVLFDDVVRMADRFTKSQIDQWLNPLRMGPFGRKIARPTIPDQQPKSIRFSDLVRHSAGFARSH